MASRSSPKSGGHAVVGKGEAAIVDTWWQTETGGFLCSTVPGVHHMKPGSAGPALPGIYPTIYDDEGVEIPAGVYRWEPVHPQPMAPA